MLVKYIKQCLEEIKVDIEKKYPGILDNVKFYVYHKNTECCAKKYFSGKRTIILCSEHIEDMWCNSMNHNKRVEELVKYCEDIKKFIRLIISHELGHIFVWKYNLVKEDTELFADAFAFNFLDWSYNTNKEEHK